MIVGNLKGSLTVKLRGTKFVVSDLSITPTTAEEGLDVNIEFNVTNRGDSPSTYTVDLYVDGVNTWPAKVYLEEGASKKLTFTVTDTVGDHEVRVNGLTGRFVVFEREPGPTWLGPINIAVMTIVVASLAMSVHLLRKRLGGNNGWA